MLIQRAAKLKARPPTGLEVQLISDAPLSPGLTHSHTLQLGLEFKLINPRRSIKAVFLWVIRMFFSPYNIFLKVNGNNAATQNTGFIYNRNDVISKPFCKL